MNYKVSELDREQWDAFHTPEARASFMEMFVTVHGELEKMLDFLTDTLRNDRGWVSKLDEILKTRTCYPKFVLDEVEETKARFENEIKAIDGYANFYLVMMDLCTYSNYMFLSQSEWEWRIFARHIYTIFYEHPKAVNTVLNSIFQIAKECLPVDYDYTHANTAKKEFTKWIDSLSAYAVKIRINVDAHFKGDFETRRSLIEDMSYYEISNAMYTYWQKSDTLFKHLVPIVTGIQHHIDTQLAALKKTMDTAILAKDYTT